MKKYLTIILILCFTTTAFSQNTQTYNFYIRAVSEDFNPKFIKGNDGYLSYIGTNEKLSEILSIYDIIRFEKAFPTANHSVNKRVFVVETAQKILVDQLIDQLPQLFEFGEPFEDVILDDIEPFDFGYKVNTQGKKNLNNLLPNDYYGGVGLTIDNHIFDYLGLSNAWNYTTGDSKIIVGISDGAVWDSNPEFENKTGYIDPPSSNHEPSHGNGVAGIAAAQGDNNYAMLGVCYDCSVLNTRYGTALYNNLLTLAQNGVRIINCSWRSYDSYSETRQSLINEIVEYYGTIIVAASGNESWASQGGNEFAYPASYDNVISVTGMAHRYEDPTDNIWVNEDGIFIASNIRNHIGYHGGFPNNDTSQPYYTYPAATTTLNSAVDIAAPAMEGFQLGNFIVNDSISYRGWPATSAAVPHVSGTIGLMLSLNPCLSFQEVESVLKLASTNIDNLPANAPYLGHYGAGALNSHEAVKMVYDMMTPGEVVKVENQSFYRWDFILESAPEKIEMRNQIFEGESTVDFKAKESIELIEDVDLHPNNSFQISNGFVSLRIDETIEVCSKSGFQPKEKVTESKILKEELKLATLYPNPNDGSFTVAVDKKRINNSIAVFIYNSFGKLIHRDFMDSNIKTFNLQGVLPGVYIVKLNSATLNESLKFIKR